MVGYQMKGINDFIHQIDQTYRGLGLPVLFGTLSILAHKSVFFLGGRGVGKTRVIKLTPDIPNTAVSNWDSFTLEGLDQDVGEAIGQDLIWKVEEFSTLSKYHRRIFVDIVPKIISDGQYYHCTKRLYINIQNCQLTLLIAIQPLLYSELCRTETRWESMAVDRFAKFLLLNPLRKDTKDIDLKISLPHNLIPLAQVAHPTIDLSKVESLFREQVSKGRSYLFARDYIRALASFLGEHHVKPEHVDLFYKMFWTYLRPFNELQFSKDLESSIEIQAGSTKLLCKICSHNEGVTKESLAGEFKVSERNVEKYAARLLEKGLIRKSLGSGRGKKTCYFMSPQYEAFFKCYSNKFTLLG